MGTGASNYLVNKWLEAAFKNTSYAGTAVYVKLHTGDPGAAGTNNPATETTRKQATFGAASAGTIANTGALTWTNISGSQDATFFTTWDDVTGGTFLLSGSIVANSYTAGDTYTVPIGSLTATMGTAS